MTDTPPCTTLDSIAVGQSATVISIQPAKLEDGVDVSRRLMELGFVPGESVRRLNGGISKGPMLFKVGHSTFALRRFEASYIVIRPQ